MTRIGILRMTEFTSPTVQAHGPYASLFGLMFDRHPVELVDVAVHEGATPASLDDADVWIITGSPASVYDDLDWIRTGEEIIREAVAREKPLVGICFGHQLVAQALGGRVEKAAAGWGIGAKTYETIEPVRWLPGGSTTIIASHQDQVVEAPSDATVWSTADYCPVAGMTIGERVWTMQGHPEFTPALVTALYDSRRDTLGADNVEAAKATLNTPLSNGIIADAIVRLQATR